MKRTRVFLFGQFLERTPWRERVITQAGPLLLFAYADVSVHRSHHDSVRAQVRPFDFKVVLLNHVTHSRDE